MGRRGLLRAAVVSDRGEPAVARDAHPAAAGLEVTAGENARCVLPPGRGRGRAAMELVAVGGDDERKVRKSLPGEYDQAHRGLSTVDRADKPFAASRSCAPPRRPPGSS